SLDNTITHGSYVNACFRTIAEVFGNYSSPPINTLVTVTDGTTSSDCTTGLGNVQHNCLWNGTTWVATSATDNALKVNLTSNSAGGGSAWERGTISSYNFPQHV